MRTFEDGKIKADCFSEARLLGFPPGVGVLLITFNRFVISPSFINFKNQLTILQLSQLRR